jgi:hypothetical protein
MLAWLPVNPPARKPLADSAREIDAFIAANRDWVIEGCYADLLQVALSHASELIFLNPGVEQCIANCRNRPWEPHKYASKEAQDRNLEMLVDWVRQYPERTDEFSLQAHQALFDGFDGNKVMHTRNPAQ